MPSLTTRTPMSLLRAVPVVGQLTALLGPRPTPPLGTVTVLAPLAEPAVTATARISALDDSSPFAVSDRTHFARLLVFPAKPLRQARPTGMRPEAKLLDLVTHLGRPQQQDDLSADYLLFTAAYDPLGRDDRDYLGHLWDILGPAADDVWRGCVDYPGRDNRAAFVGFLANRLVPARYVFTPRSDVTGTVTDVRGALRLRQQVIDLAVSTQDADDAVLRRRFREAFERADQGGDQGATGDAEATALVHPGPGPEDFDDPFDDEFLLAERHPDDELPDEELDEAAPPDEDHRWSGESGGPVPVRPERRLRAQVAPDHDDIQGLVVGYPGHEAAAYLFLKITDPDRARRWLGGVDVTSAAEARRQIRILKAATAGESTESAGDDIAVHVALSYAGLARLGVPAEDLQAFDDPFRAGMAAREASLVPSRGTSPWRSPFRPDRAGRSPVHVMVHVSATSRGAVTRTLDRLDDELEGSGFHVVARQEGHRIVDPRQPESERNGARARYVEHFGFTDGLSQPRIRDVSRSERAQGDVLPTGEVLLGYPDVDDDLAGRGLAETIARNGTYLVYRKLEQDVDAFHAMVRRVGARFGAGPDGDGADTAAAKLVGRHRNGTPLTEGAAADPFGDFGFQRDADGFTCPVGAHVRRVNPRDSRPLEVRKPRKPGEPGPATAPVEDKDPIEPRLARRHRMIRRGMPYGTYLPNGSGGELADLPPGLPPDLFSDGFAPVTAAPAERDLRTEERGLLFVALVGDIGRQFEFVQAHWMSDGNAFRLGGDQDVFAGAGGPGMKITIQDSDRPTFLPLPRPVVTCRGGEYFFLPGVRALRAIAAVATP